MSTARVLTHEERLAMTQKNSGFLQKERDGKDLPPVHQGVEEVNEKVLDNKNCCPDCGGELVRFESCYRCPNCGYSKCG